MKSAFPGVLLGAILLAASPRICRGDSAAPPPYIAQEVSFHGGRADVNLAGTITLPAAARPGARLPAVLLIHGTGRVDRDETISNHKPFRTIAEALTEAGYAVLRYDKRGVGASTGTIDDITIPDLTADAEAAFDYLRSRPDIDPKRIGLLGHSEGGMIAPIIAGQRDGVAWLVLLGAPTVPGREIVPYQIAQGALDRGRSAADAQAAVDSARRLFGIVLREQPAAQRESELTAALEAEREARNLPLKFVEDQKRSLLSPYFRNVLAYDPLPALKALHQPVLMLYGERDHQVPPSLNLAPARAALQGKVHTEVRVLPELNHLFFIAKTGAVTEYATIADGVASRALDSIRDWLKHNDKP